jgi:hypothetical protein
MDNRYYVSFDSYIQHCEISVCALMPAFIAAVHASMRQRFSQHYACAQSASLRCMHASLRQR